MRVLHSITVFVDTTQNWAYPQIVQVPNVDSRVLCCGRNNAGIFPIDPARVSVSPPPWSQAFGLARLFHALAYRSGGMNDAACALGIRRWAPQIIHAHFGPRGWSALGLKKFCKAALVTSFYGYDAWQLPQKEPVWRDRYRELFAVGEAFFVEGPAMRDRLCALGCPREKIVIHHIGVDLATLPFQERLFSSELKVAMVGRFCEKKGLTDGLRACAMAREKGVDLRVTIVGGPNPNDPGAAGITQELQTLANGAALSNRVHFTGYLTPEGTKAVLSEHNVFLCPSKHSSDGDAEGGSPVVLTEAMASGLLCIGTTHCDIPEVILDHETGFLAPEADAGKMADILLHCSRNPGQAVELTANGRRHIERNFSLGKQLDGLYQLYTKVTAGKAF